jgi:hypothetical protein
VVKALAGAHGWRRLLESQEYGTPAEFADTERVSRSYVCGVAGTLTPDIRQRILDGRPIARLAQLLKPSPSEWEQQRDELC